MSKKNKKKTEKIQRLSDWEWTTLVAAWRYYECRSTIASATFPADVVRRFWGSGKYADSALHQIAYQFAVTDHGADGERFWSGNGTIHDCDRRAWCKFYAFCKAYCDGFSTVVLDGDDPDGHHIHDEPLCFYCDYTGRWYHVNAYIYNPQDERWCGQEFIKEVHR